MRVSGCCVSVWHHVAPFSGSCTRLHARQMCATDVSRLTSRQLTANHTTCSMPGCRHVNIVHALFLFCCVQLLADLCGHGCVKEGLAGLPVPARHRAQRHCRHCGPKRRELLHSECSAATAGLNMDVAPCTHQLQQFGRMWSTCEQMQHCCLGRCSERAALQVNGFKSCVHTCTDVTLD
jgi:hypothetical protein